MFGKARNASCYIVRFLIRAKTAYFSFISFHVEGGAGIFGFADLVDFWFGFSVFAP